MIQTISVKNFKIFKNQTNFPLSKLNLLTGINGRGKSSFLQALLLIHQSYQHNTDLKKIILNGASVKLGAFNDLRNHGISRSEPIHLSYQFQMEDASLQTIRFILKPDEEDEMIANAQVIGDNLAPHFERIHYIAADRNGPQELYFKSTLPNFLTVGKKGEYVGLSLIHI
jgi:predicted ATPase